MSDSKCETCATQSTCSNTFKGKIVDCSAYRQEQEPIQQNGLGPRPETKEHKKDERDFQRLIEGWLRMEGYHLRNTSDIMSSESPRKGWQIHLHEARSNPYLLDIVLLSHRGMYTEFELKVPPIRWAGPEQKRLCMEYGKPVFTSLDEVREHVKNWEGVRRGK